MNRLVPYPNRRFFSYLFYTCFCLAPLNQAQAQLQIQFPGSRIVFQRDAANQSTFTVAGTCPAAVDRLEVRLSPRQLNQGAFYDWQLLDGSPAQGQFRGAITAVGGWYRLDVRAIQQGAVVATGTVDRVGVGEVFVLAGQSNARGLLELGAVSAADDRINCINYENTQNDTTQLPPPVFSPVVAETFISPRGRSAWCWGRLGDLLASRLNVPILFYNVASAATTVKNWRESAQGLPTSYTFGEPLPPGMPYNQLKRVLKDYVPITGVRAVLWHQGEAEPYDTVAGQQPPAFPINYTSDLTQVIERSRQEAGVNLSWMVARVSIDNNIAQLVQSNHYQPVIDAQNQTIQTVANVFPGPETDVIQFPRTVVGAGVHFSGEGLLDLANAWNASLTDAFFSASTPVAPPGSQRVDLQLAIRADKRVVAVNGPVTFSVIVTNTGTAEAPQVRIINALPPNLSFRGSSSFVFDQGSLSATIPVIAPGESIVLTYEAAPLAAGYYQNAAEISRCGALDIDSHPGSDVADGEDDQGWVDFQTIEPDQAFFRTPVRSGTPPPPAVRGNQPVPPPGLADLSLQVVASNVVAAIGQPWSLTLVVTNRGGSAAQNVQIGCVLPPNVTFADSPNMSLSGGFLRGLLPTIPAGESELLWFTAIPNGTGATTIQAQIEAASPGDPDSTPNNGFANGEDDTAQSFIRVR